MSIEIKQLCMAVPYKYVEELAGDGCMVLVSMYGCSFNMGELAGDGFTMSRTECPL